MIFEAGDRTGHPCGGVVRFGKGSVFAKFRRV